MTWRLVLLLLASQLSTLSSQLFAAEVYGQLLNANSTPYTNEVLFRALSTPLNANPRIIAGGDFRVTPDTNGNFTLNLQAGDYRVFTRLDSKGFIISVPDGTNSYLINSRITSALTYTPAAMVLGSATNVPKAASATSGLVKTDTSTADPVVYLKTTVDTLLAARVAAVPTLTALLAQSPTNFADSVEIRGRTSIGDGGHGVLNWYGNSSESTNEGVVFAYPYGSATGRWKRPISGFVDVRWFGASESATNNEPAIEAAMAAANALSLPTYVPTGRFTNAAPVDAPSNTILFGDGEGSILVRNFLGGDRNATLRNKDCPIFYLMSYPWTHVSTNITFKHLAFATASSNTAGAHLALGYANHVRLHDLTFFRTYTNWATAMCADNLVATKLRVVENKEVFEDGIHFLGGGNILATDLDINSGDDAIAVSTEHMDIPLTNVLIANARITSQKGGIRIYRTAATAQYPIQYVKFKGITGFGGLSKNFAISLQGCDIAATTNGVYGAMDISLEDFNVQSGTVASHGGAVNGYGQSVLAHYVKNLTLERVNVPRSIWHGISLTYCKNVTLNDCNVGTPELVSFASVYATDTDYLAINGGTFANTNQGYDTIRADRVGTLAVRGAYFPALTTNCNAIRVRPLGGTNDVMATGNVVTGATGGRFLLVDNADIRNVTVSGNYLDPGLAAAVTFSGVTYTGTYQSTFNTGKPFTQQQGPIFVSGVGSTTDLLTIERAGVGSMAWRVLGATMGFGGYNGQIALGTSFTDSTAKFGRLGVIHYTIGEEPLGLVAGSSTATEGVLYYGGGQSTFNAATAHKFYGATNSTTQTGSEIVRLALPGTVRGTALWIYDGDTGTLREVGVTNQTLGGTTFPVLYLK